jgi:N-formylmaleamate deformylase
VREPTRVTEGNLDELRALGAESRWIDGPDGALHVLDYGGERAPMLVLPGITSPAVTFDFVVAALRDVVRPIVVDPRGRGLSDTGSGYAIEDFVADSIAVVRALELDRTLVLGHSLGARIGAALAASGAVELGAVTLVDPPLTGPGRDPYPTSRDAFVEQLREGYAGTTADQIRRFYPKWPRAELLLRARWVATCDENAVLATYDAFSQEDFFAWWPDIAPPVALIRGGDSPVVTEVGAAEAARANPRATQHTIAGAGHMVPWDETALFVAELRAILQNHLAARDRRR